MGFDNIWFVWNVCRYEMFLAVNAPNFVNYEPSSKECFIYKGLMGFLVLEWWFFDGMKSGEMAWLVGFIEVGIEVVLNFESPFLGQSMDVEQIAWFSLPVICF